MSQDKVYELQTQERNLTIKVNGLKGEKEKLEKEISDFNKKTKINELLEQIHKIRTERLGKVEEYLEHVGEVIKGIKNTREALLELSANDFAHANLYKAEIDKYKGVMKGWSSEKDVMREFRYIMKILQNEEGRYENELSKIEAHEA